MKSIDEKVQSKVRYRCLVRIRMYGSVFRVLCRGKFYSINLSNWCVRYLCGTEMMTWLTSLVIKFNVHHLWLWHSLSLARSIFIFFFCSIFSFFFLFIHIIFLWNKSKSGAQTLDYIHWAIELAERMNCVRGAHKINAHKNCTHWLKYPVAMRPKATSIVINVAIVVVGVVVFVENYRIL